MAQGPSDTILVVIRITLRIRESKVRNPDPPDWRRFVLFEHIFLFILVDEVAAVWSQPVLKQYNGGTCVKGNPSLLNFNINSPKFGTCVDTNCLSLGKILLRKGEGTYLTHPMLLQTTDRKWYNYCLSNHAIFSDDHNWPSRSFASCKQSVIFWRVAKWFQMTLECHSISMWHLSFWLVDSAFRSLRTSYKCYFSSCPYAFIHYLKCCFCSRELYVMHLLMNDECLWKEQILWLIGSENSCKSRSC